MQTPNANIVGDFQTRLKAARESLETLSEQIAATYPKSDGITDSIDLAVQDLKDAESMLIDFDPDEAVEDDDEAVEGQEG